MGELEHATKIWYAYSKFRNDSACVQIFLTA